jgi:PAS domain S-box-containing protein
MTTWLRRLAPLDRAAAAYSVAYFAWMAAKVAGLPVPAFIADVAFYPLGLVVAWVNWRNARVAGLDSRTRLAWRLLAVAALVLWASGTTWTVWLALGGSGAWAAEIDRVAVVQYVLSIAAYLSFPGRTFPRKGGARFVLDVALIAIAGFVVAFYVGLRLLLLDPNESATLAVVQSSAEWLLFVVASVGCMQKREPIIRRVLIMLLASNLISLAGNSVNAVLPYHSGDPVDLTWFIAWVLRWAAARVAWRHYLAVEGGTAPPQGAVQEYRSNPFAYVLVAGTFLLLFGEMLAGNTRFIGVLAIVASVLGGLLILRQLAELEENRRLFDAQLEGESRFRTLVRHSSDAVIVVNGDGIVSYVGPSLHSVFGRDARIAPGTPFRDLLPAEHAGIADAMLGANPAVPTRFEATMRTAPDTWREVEAVWTDLREDPAVHGIVVNCRDVTDRNQVERHLRQTQELDAVGHLAGGLAHDLNNVLSIIRGYAELLRSDLPNGSSADGDLAQILAAVDRAAGVTGKVLAFSRKQPGQAKVLDLNAVVGGLGPMLRHMMKDQVEVRVEPGADLWPVRADQGQVEQVIVNLSTNAADAMPQGGVVRITTSNRAVPDGPPAAAMGDSGRVLADSGGVRVAAGPESVPAGHYVALSVVDHGVGMSTSVAAHIFEPFFSTKGKDRGLGLGLSVVQSIVTEMGGRVLVQSAEGRGSTFTVLLPRAT